MPDLIVGNLLFFPGFFKILFFGVFIWLLVREAYKFTVSTQFRMYSRIIDIEILSIIVYFVHLLYLFKGVNA